LSFENIYLWKNFALGLTRQSENPITSPLREAVVHEKGDKSSRVDKESGNPHNGNSQLKKFFES
jgi:hypothetical protein